MLHAVGIGQDKCQRCGERKLAYQHEGAGGDVYRCLNCHFRSVHRERDGQCGFQPYGKARRFAPHEEVTSGS